MSGPDYLTLVRVRISRTEVAVYDFDGAVDYSAVGDLIASGEYEPVESKIKSEDVDIIELRVMRR